MPNGHVRAPKVCPREGCPNDQPCPTHTPDPWAGSHSHGFPTSKRAEILRRDPTCRCPGCPKCTTAGCRRPSTQADHITDVALGGTDDTTNGQGLCTPCHQHKTLTAATLARGGVPPQTTRP